VWPARHFDDGGEAGSVVARVVEFRHVFGAKRAFVEAQRFVEIGHRELEVVNAAKRRPVFEGTHFAVTSIRRRRAGSMSSRAG
jgi:hypothetical protein